MYPAIIYLMIIPDGEILPLIISSSIVRIVPRKDSARYQYVVCFKNLSQAHRKKLQTVID